MPRTIKLTSKRQATFPVDLCAELGLRAGDELTVERREVHGESAWLLRPARADTSWVGSLKLYAKGKSHRMSAIRTSIAKGWGGAARS